MKRLTKLSPPLFAARAPHVGNLIRAEQRRGMGYFADYPLLVWVRRNPAVWAAQGWREKAGCNCVERIK